MSDHIPHIHIYVYSYRSLRIRTGSTWSLFVKYVSAKELVHSEQKVDIHNDLNEYRIMYVYDFYFIDVSFAFLQT